MIRTIYVSASTIKARCTLISNKNENNLVIALAIYNAFENECSVQILSSFNLSAAQVSGYQLLTILTADNLDNTHWLYQ